MWTFFLSALPLDCFFSLVWKNRRLSNVGHFLMEKHHHGHGIVFCCAWKFSESNLFSKVFPALLLLTMSFCTMKPGGFRKTYIKGGGVHISTNPQTQLFCFNARKHGCFKVFFIKITNISTTFTRDFSWWKVNLFFLDRGIRYNRMMFGRCGTYDLGHELQDMTLWRSFDWILCLEVGEHVPKQCAVRTVAAAGGWRWWLENPGKYWKGTTRWGCQGFWCFFFSGCLVTLRISKDIWPPNFMSWWWKRVWYFQFVNQWRTALWRPASLFSKVGVHL